MDSACPEEHSVEILSDYDHDKLRPHYLKPLFGNKGNMDVNRFSAIFLNFQWSYQMIGIGAMASTNIAIDRSILNSQY